MTVVLVVYDSRSGHVIGCAVSAMSRQELQTVFYNSLARCQACLTVEGGYF